MEAELSKLGATNSLIASKLDSRLRGNDGFFGLRLRLGSITQATSYFLLHTASKNRRSRAGGNLILLEYRQKASISVK
jgi:hypothetical protein